MEEQRKKLAAIFTYHSAENLDPYDALKDHFNAGRESRDNFPLPPRDFDAAPEEIRKAWAEPWNALQQEIAEMARGMLDRGELSGEDFGKLDTLEVAKELWSSAAEGVKRYFTPYVPATGVANLTVVNGGKEPKFQRS